MNSAQKKSGGKNKNKKRKRRKDSNEKKRDEVGKGMNSGNAIHNLMQS